VLGLIFILAILLIGFALGYGVREIMSRLHHAEARRRRLRNMRQLAETPDESRQLMLLKLLVEEEAKNPLSPLAPQQNIPSAPTG
jgi:hypothetical protein